MSEVIGSQFATQNGVSKVLHVSDNIIVTLRSIVKNVFSKTTYFEALQASRELQESADDTIVYSYVVASLPEPDLILSYLTYGIPMAHMY
eukprot:scaffold15451_cov34-Prasinocladus_malaysianus.AAC.1